MNIKHKQEIVLNKTANTFRKTLNNFKAERMEQENRKRKSNKSCFIGRRAKHLPHNEFLVISLTHW